MAEEVKLRKAEDYWQKRTVLCEDYADNMFGVLTQMMPISIVEHMNLIRNQWLDQLKKLEEEEKCEHGKALNDYCEPCGRIHGG
jgi:hypothetical protein